MWMISPASAVGAGLTVTGACFGATAIGFLVLRQVPTTAELLSIALVIGGIALHLAK